MIPNIERPQLLFTPIVVIYSDITFLQIFHLVAVTNAKESRKLIAS